MGHRNENGEWQDSCLARVQFGEPIFVLRAQDESAPLIVEQWIKANPQISEEKRAEALNTIGAMLKWPNRKKAD